MTASYNFICSCSHTRLLLCIEDPIQCCKCKSEYYCTFHELLRARRSNSCVRLRVADIKGLLWDTLLEIVQHTWEGTCGWKQLWSLLSTLLTFLFELRIHENSIFNDDILSYGLFTVLAITLDMFIPTLTDN